MRGKLPDAFWLKDKFGDVTATDFAFMSTALNQDICTEYMDPLRKNVLWEMRCGDETSEGFHSGADVSMMSQYPKEQEHLFPPLTMLRVISVTQTAETHKRLQKHDSAEARFAEMPEEEEAATTQHGKSVAFTRIVVQPTFV